MIAAIMPESGGIPEHHDDLAALAQRQVGPRLRSRWDAPDLVQQVWLRVCERPSQVQDLSPGELRGYLRTTLKNLVTDAIRRTTGKVGAPREQSFSGDSGSAVDRVAQFVADISTPSQKVQRRETAADLAAALNRLPADQRDAVRLRHLDDLPLAEVAARMGRSVASVAGLLRRGLDALRADEQLPH